MAKALRLLAQEQTAEVSNSSSLSPQIHAVTVRGITAHFGGENPASELQVPLEYGVQVLWFTFEGDDAVYVFKPAGELFFSDWRFDLFSPDGAHVLLLQDHHGPYHIVKTGSLRDYLTGRTGPDHIVTKEATLNEPAFIHSEGRWVSPREIVFVVNLPVARGWGTDAMTAVLDWAGRLAIVLAAIILGELEHMKEFDHFIEAQKFWFLAGTGGIMALGFVLLVRA